MKETIQVKDMTQFVAKHGVRIILRGLVSLATVACLLALYYAFAPREESYKAELLVTLESRDGAIIYPNGDLFSLHDIVSAPVLNRIWTKYEMNKKGVKFEDFTRWFSVVAYDKGRAKIDAEFHGKMSKRNVTVTELNALQKEYETKLASLASNRFTLEVRPGRLLTRDTAAKLLVDIPEAWYSEYVTLKAPTIPAVVATDAIKTYVSRTKTLGGRVLELMDVIHQYLDELKETCSFVRHRILRGRNVMIDGKDFGAYESELAIFASESLRLKNQLLATGSKADIGGYVAARQDDMACEQMELDERIKAVQQTLDAIGEVKRPNGANSTITATDEPTSRATQQMVQKYAQELTALREKMAVLAARKLYHQQIEQYVKTNSNREKTDKEAQEITAAISVYTSQLLELGSKIVAFRDQCLKTYRTSDQFYVISTTPTYAKSFAITLPRVALGMLALFALVNFIGLVRLWNEE